MQGGMKAYWPTFCQVSTFLETVGLLTSFAYPSRAKKAEEWVQTLGGCYLTVTYLGQYKG
jgi:hypothetical protein